MINYSFNSEEILSMAKFLRKNELELPSELFNFSKFIENEIYKNMTLDQVDKFYNEK